MTRKPREYDPHWPAISKRARRLARGRCVLCLWRRSRHVHHVRYKDIFGQLIAGRERPGWDVFPVCVKCHGVLHRSDRYHEHRNRNDNRNDRRTVARLVLLWRIRRLPLEWMVVIGVGAVVFLIHTAG